MLPSFFPFGELIRSKVAVIGPMQFTQGQGHWNGATMAAEEINKAGGISVKGVKRPVEVIKVDSNEFLSIPDATNAMELAISKHKADFLVGGFRTEAVMVMQDIAMDNKKIFMGCGAAHPELCERVTKNYDRYRSWFRVTPINSKFLVKVDFILLNMAAEAMKKELDIPKIKVAIVAEKAAWADPMVKIAEATLPKMGMETVGVWRPSPTATDTTCRTFCNPTCRSQHHFHHLLVVSRHSSCQASRRAKNSRRGRWN